MIVKVTETKPFVVRVGTQGPEGIQGPIGPGSDHATLSNLQGGAVGERYHLTAQQRSWLGQDLRASAVPTFAGLGITGVAAGVSLEITTLTALVPATSNTYTQRVLQGGGSLAFGGDASYGYIQTFGKGLQLNNQGNNTILNAAGGNVGIGTANFGASAQKVLAIASGTAPTASPADAIQMWSADRNGTAGKAGLHLRTEDGVSHVFGDRVGIGTVSPGWGLTVGANSALGVEATPITGASAAGTTGGTLTAGTYGYRVCGIDMAGAIVVTAADVTATIDGATQTAVTVSWAYRITDGIKTYRIYGRTPGGQTMYWEAPAGSSSFTDTGTAGTAGTVPGNTIGQVFYADGANHRAVGNHLFQTRGGGFMGISNSPGNSAEVFVQLMNQNGNWGLMMLSNSNGPYIGAYNGGGLYVYPFSNSNGTADTTKGVLTHFDFNAMSVKLFGAAIGTSANKVLAIGSGTAPTASPTDAVQLWCADRNATAGKAGLHIRTEDGTSHVFGDRVGIGLLDPGNPLEVLGSIRSRDTAGSNGIVLRYSSGEGNIANDSGPISITPASGFCYVYKSGQNGQFSVYGSGGSPNWVKLEHTNTKAKITTGAGALDITPNNHINLKAANAAPADVDIPNGHISCWLDETASQLKFRIRKSDGTYATAAVAYA